MHINQDTKPFRLHNISFALLNVELTDRQLMKHTCLKMLMLLPQKSRNQTSCKKSMVSWVVIPCSLEKAWHFSGTCLLQEAGGKQSLLVLAWLTLWPWRWKQYIANVELSLNYTELELTRLYHCCESLTSNRVVPHNSEGHQGMPWTSLTGLQPCLQDCMLW
jgi:hypothetical protein